MLSPYLTLLATCYIWFIKALKLTSLPTLYHRLSSKRGIRIKLLRDLEKDAIKYAKRQLDVHYLTHCLELDLCPEKLKFKIPKVNAYRQAKDFYKVALKKHIEEAKAEERNAAKLFNQRKNEIFLKTTMYERTCLINLLVDHVRKVTENVIINHSRKLTSLWKKQRPKAPDCIINLASKKLSIAEEEALRYGLEHHILPIKINIDQVKTNIEKLSYTATKQTDKKASYEFRHRIIHTVHAFINDSRNICGSQKNQAKHKVLKNLANNKKLKICKFDKGAGVAILNSNDYYEKLEKIVNDKTKFKKIIINDKKPTNHPVFKKYSSVKNYISKYIIKNDENKNLIEKIGASPGKLYGLVKVHKPNNPLRPVCSMVNTPEYELAKYLDNLIKPFIPNKYMLYSSQSFLSKLGEFNISPGDKMVSFDVESLFTNVPLKETIDLIAEHIYATKMHPEFSKTVFKNMMKTATQGYFLFKDSLYQQVDGVTMGSPLGPTVANFFLAHLENKILQTDCKNKPALYLRYVDDIFAIFRHDQGHDLFLNTLNKQHPNIRFTVEEQKETLPFLDVEIKLNNSDFDSWLWRKKTHTGLLLNFTAVTPFKWKTGLIICLCNRAWEICSTSTLFKQEIEKLRNMFIKNNYPIDFFNKIVEKFWQTKHSNSIENKEERTFDFMIKIPYIGKKSIEFGKKISVLFKDEFDIKVNTVFTSFKVKTFFQLKTRTPEFLRNHIIYKFTCPCDTGSSYIGVTSRPWCERIQEHLGFKKSGDQSAIKKHLDICQKCFEETRVNGSNHFKILRECKNKYEAQINEALMIKRNTPKLNKQQHNNGTSFVLRIF